ncbi:MAG: type VII toxin-antitoxin system MntA family adenylyltransferase antitoxin, partial [Candidatus Thorarchaeota archaeon]
VFHRLRNVVRMVASARNAAWVVEKVRGIADTLRTRYGVRFAVLFGSLATGDAGPNSDVDIGVYLDKGRDIDLNVELEIGVLLEKVLEREDVDLVILNHANPALVFQAVNRGLLIFCVDEGEYEDYCVRAAAVFYDYQEFLSRQFDVAREFFERVASE